MKKVGSFRNHAKEANYSSHRNRRAFSLLCSDRLRSTRYAPTMPPKNQKQINDVRNGKSRDGDAGVKMGVAEA